MTILTFRASSLPYQLKALGDGRCILLNRDYKPLGSVAGHVEYERHPSVMPRTPTVMEMGRMGLLPGGYFYDDATVPTTSKLWARYAAILQKVDQFNFWEDVA